MHIVDKNPKVNELSKVNLGERAFEVNIVINATLVRA
jgi:hypothetical protein